MGEEAANVERQAELQDLVECRIPQQALGGHGED
jgi:hypothetical protein